MLFAPPATPENPMWHRGNCPSARSLSIPPKEVQPLAAYH